MSVHMKRTFIFYNWLLCYFRWHFSPSYHSISTCWCDDSCSNSTPCDCTESDTWCWHMWRYELYSL